MGKGKAFVIGLVTGTLGGANLSSRLASKSSSLPRDSPTNLGGVPSVVEHAGPSSEVTEIPTGHRERCIRRYVPSVARIQWFPLDPVVTDRCIVAIASAE